MIDKKPELKNRIERILDEMCHSWSLRSIRFTGYFLLKIIKSIYQHIWVQDYLPINTSSFYYPLIQNNNLRDSINCLSRESPILFMPTHRSYADFLLFDYICFHLNLPLPSIAAGIDFLGLNQVASLLRACGAFFIRRSFKHLDDDLYWQTFRAYIQTQLRGGERPIEFFIEGTRSRTGKSLFPKTGLLSVALELFLTSQIPDLIIIPVSISYDKTLEESLYAKELHPFIDPSSLGKKPSENTKHLINGAKAILKRDHGSVFISFCEPISLRDLAVKQDLRFEHTLDSKYDLVKRQSSQELKFIHDLSKLIIARQQNHLVFSPFTLVSLSLLLHVHNLENKNQDLIEIPLAMVLEDIKSLSLLMSFTNLSYAIENQLLDMAALKSIKLHENIIKLSNDMTEIQIENTSMTAVLLQYYANQPMQLLIDFACYLYVNGNNSRFKRLKNILSREFIHQSDDIDEHYFSLLNSQLIDNNRINQILFAQIEYYLKGYLKIANWFQTKLKSSSLKDIELRDLVKEIQKETELCSDLIKNSLNILLPNLRQTKVNLDSQFNVGIIVDEINDFLNSREVNFSFNNKFKSNL